MAFDRLLPQVSLRHEPRPQLFLASSRPRIAFGRVGRRAARTHDDPRGDELGRPCGSHGPQPEASCKHLTTRFVQADLKDADAVVAFGQGLDAITVEIEHVSVEGLQRLADQGVEVVPRPRIWA